MGRCPDGQTAGTAPGRQGRARGGHDGVRRQEVFAVCQGRLQQRQAELLQRESRP